LDAEHPNINLLPKNPDYDGHALEFRNRLMSTNRLQDILSKIPASLDLRKVDRELVLKTQWGPEDVETAGGLEAWEQQYLGVCIVHKGKVLSEAFAGPPARGIYEPGVFTQEFHRGRGYASIVSAQLIQEIESRGGVTYWNCAKQNVPSTALGRKLGYQVVFEYRVLWWKSSKE
jgi:hypothetical protein